MLDFLYKRKHVFLSKKGKSFLVVLLILFLTIFILYGSSGAINNYYMDRQCNDFFSQNQISIVSAAGDVSELEYSGKFRVYHTGYSGDFDSNRIDEVLCKAVAQFCKKEGSSIAYCQDIAIPFSVNR